MQAKRILVAVKEGKDTGDRQTWERNTRTARERDRDKRVLPGKFCNIRGKITFEKITTEEK